MIILFDMDGTLLDSNKHCNYKLLRRKLSEFGDNIKFGINSNRAIEDVQDFYDKLGLNGPIILENGCYILNNKEKIELISKELNIPKLKEKIIKVIKTNTTGICGGKNFSFNKTDTSEALLKGDNYIPPIENGLHVLCNKFRKFTINLHIRLVKQNKLLRTPHITNLTADIIRKNIENEMKIFDVKNTDGTISIVPKECSKGKAIEVLKNKTKDEVIMIGDGQEELSVVDHADKLFCVNNAINRLKEVSDYVSQESYYPGVVDIIDKIREEVLK